ncbi:hypothetical protein RND81_05G039300 [Saponaria officinalis]|uniref:Helitron helicase-like domain-containing protein n=1 Tax=Saponaria officinalis TaxID=3572 RepID=A0AAW1KU25_SAPOF
MRIAEAGQQLPRQLHKLSKPTNCAECGALKFEYESMHFCCGDGQIKLPANEYPSELVRLYTSRDEYAVHFQKYDRLYNNLFAFTSIGGCIDAKTQKGIYVFKLYGQIYHNLPELIPNDAHPKYLQLYFYDGQHEAENHLRCFPELHQNENTQIVINRNPVLDQRVYNALTSDKVAVIWSEDTSSSSSSGLHILVTGKSNESHRIMNYYDCYDPLQYPLLFPRGSTEGQSSRDRQVSCREYYYYMLQNRPNNYLLRAGRCLQQYVVHMGPRDMKKRYLNAMSLVQKYGKPNLFITMTYNSSWPEIKEQLSVGEEAQNRPDLVSRVFQEKLLALKKQIMEKQIFGEVAALVYVVKFQKRRLPHAHFLIILKPEFKMKCP